MSNQMDISKLPPSDLDNMVAVPPPPGQVSNFINPPYRGNQSRIAMYVMLPLMGIALMLRVYTRARVTRRFGADDYLAIISAICVGGYCGVLFWMLKGPMGKHVWDVPLSHLDAAFQKSNLASQCLYNLAALFVKTTLLVLYLRIFHPSGRAQIMIWAGIVFVVLFYVACSIAQIKLYIPPNQNWMSTRSASVVTALLNVSAVQGVVSVVTDFYALFIPLHLVVGLTLPLSRKIGVCAIFLTGMLACVCSIIATVYRFRARPSQDSTWVTVPAYTLGVIELNAGILCSCMPVVFTWLKRVANKESTQSFLRYLRARRSKASSEGQDQQPHSESKQLVLSIPKPTMTGLRSFLRGVHRSQAQPTTDMASYDDLDSVGDDYHVQLRAAK